MKITVSINLGGYFFNIDEDAYAELKLYLRNLELQFAGEESASEILSDIETRIAELFRARLTPYKQVISMDDVRYAISVLGSPEDISDPDEKQVHGKFSSHGYHRMYRDPDGRIFGGVCSGLAAYLNWDTLLVRILFAVMIFAFGVGIGLYLVLWIVVPEAKTTAQKLEMRGDPVTIENIKESVKSEFETVKKKMNL